MGNARGIPRDPKSSPVRMRRADQFPLILLSSSHHHHPLPLSRSRVLAAPEESKESLGTWPRCLFAPTYPLVLLISRFASPSLFSLSLFLLISPLAHRSFFLSFFYISAVSPSSPLAVPSPFYVVASYIPDTAPTNKTLSSFSPYVSSSRFVSSSLSR